MDSDAVKIDDSEADISQLTECLSCNHKIAKLADTCPNCGGPNKWTHPKIRFLIETPGTHGVGCNYTYRYTRMTVDGETEARLNTSGVFKCIGIFFWISITTASFGIITGLVLGTIAAIIASKFVKSKKTFHASFNPPSWSSSDESFWLPLRKHFGL